MKTKGWYFLVWGTPLLFAAVILAQTRSFRASKSPTYDETYFLGTALATVQQGFLDEHISGAGVAPIPILLNYVPVAWRGGGETRSDLWQGQITDPPLINQARFLNARLVGIPTMLLVYCWLSLRRGYAAGAFGAALVTFSPTMIAHFSLATTDACFALTALIALGFLTRYWKDPTNRYLCWLSLGVSLAISSKYSGIFLLPCTLAVMTLTGLSGQTELTRRIIWPLLKQVVWKFSLFLILLIPFTWALHLFSFTGPLKTVSYEETPDDSAWVRVLGRGPVAQQIMEVSHETLKRPAPFAGVLFQFLHNASGHDAYLMGAVSEHGWWYYFPVAWSLKSTPVELLFTLLGICLAGLLLFDFWKSIQSQPAALLPAEQNRISPEWKQEPTSHAPLVWLLAGSMFLGMALTSHLNLGQRYTLFLYPLLILFTIDQVWRCFEFRTWVLYVFGGLCSCIQILSITSIQPNYLSYFNDSIGGPAAGRFYLLDSNLDWGQDLPALKEILNQLPPEDRERSLLYYFGTANPHAYGISALDSRQKMPEDLDQWKYLALSTNYLQGLYTGKKDPFAGFRSLKPKGQAGYSIYLFDLSTPQARKALQHADNVLREMSNQKQMIE
ncbi:ArnT family glycosyltransferase [Gimesia sp.]|uniref:ArnT family glycosyltransferase n=1 Tax=Gimesia sp. TaxID=2024833 RepID=UPI003A8DDFFC